MYGTRAHKIVILQTVGVTVGGKGSAAGKPQRRKRSKRLAGSALQDSLLQCFQIVLVSTKCSLILFKLVKQLESVKLTMKLKNDNVSVNVI